MKPKMYSISYTTKETNGNGDIIPTEEGKKVAKGIAKCEIKKTLRHEMYKMCLFEEKATINSMRCIRSKNHELYMDVIVKRGLCSFDDKCYLKNPFESYAFGHYKIKEL